MDPDHPLIADRTGAGILVAVIDSGIHPHHPHVHGVRGGVAFAPDGRAHDDHTDHIGHGTAVAAAIREKAPGADLLAIRIFQDRLRAPSAVLVEALHRALDDGARIVNLSLGTPRASSRHPLTEAVKRANDRGAFIVSAAGDPNGDLYPGALPGAVGVVVDRTCSRHEVRLQTGPPFRVAASGFPRPIPGVPPEQNLQGISFAVANATGILARLLDGRADLRTPADIAGVLR